MVDEWIRSARSDGRKWLSDVWCTEWDTDIGCIVETFRERRIWYLSGVARSYLFMGAFGIGTQDALQRGSRKPDIGSG
jgi:hypothetical protein